MQSFHELIAYESVLEVYCFCMLLLWHVLSRKEKSVDETYVMFVIVFGMCCQRGRSINAISQREKFEVRGSNLMQFD